MSHSRNNPACEAIIDLLKEMIIEEILGFLRKKFSSTLRKSKIYYNWNSGKNTFYVYQVITISWRGYLESHWDTFIILYSLNLMGHES